MDNASLVIQQLEQTTYQGFPYTACYETHKYYEVRCIESGFYLEEAYINELIRKKFTDSLFGSWLENPIAFGVFKGETLLGFIEGSIESWHNLFRISNIFVYEEYRQRGIGRLLMNYMIEYVKENELVRGIILETQTSNYNAIALYKSCGFSLCRIDISEYTNEDVERKEVRIDFILKM